MSLEFSAVLAQRHFEAELHLGERERLAVLGHNGAGKSTLLSLLAGTLRPDRGRAVLDERVLFDLGTHRTQWLQPHARGISLLAQEALLFPHLSVLENVAFGPRVAGRGRRGARTAARHWLERVGAAEFAARKPGQLSGGQAQRVAIARALAAEPRLILLDEPMAALDVAVAPSLRRLLGRVLKDRATVVVTHDPLDALLLSDRVIVFEDGRVAEAGPTELVLRRPRTRFTARISGLNLIRGAYGGKGVVAREGLVVEGTHTDGESPGVGEPAAAVFSPTGLSVFVEPAPGSPRNNLRVRISELEPRGELVRVRALDPTGQAVIADVTPHAVAELDLYPGRDVTYAVKAAAVTVFAL